MNPLVVESLDLSLETCNLLYQSVLLSDGTGANDLRVRVIRIIFG